MWTTEHTIVTDASKGIGLEGLGRCGELVKMG